MDVLSDRVGTIPAILFSEFQLVFEATVCAIAVGGVCERGRLAPLVPFVFVSCFFFFFGFGEGWGGVDGVDGKGEERRNMTDVNNVSKTSFGVPLSIVHWHTWSGVEDFSERLLVCLISLEVSE